MFGDRSVFPIPLLGLPVPQLFLHHVLWYPSLLLNQLIHRTQLFLAHFLMYIFMDVMCITDPSLPLQVAHEIVLMKGLVVFIIWIILMKVITSRQELLRPTGKITLPQLLLWQQHNHPPSWKGGRGKAQIRSAIRVMRVSVMSPTLILLRATGKKPLTLLLMWQQHNHPPSLEEGRGNGRIRRGESKKKSDFQLSCLIPDQFVTIANHKDSFFL